MAERLTEEQVARRAEGYVFDMYEALGGTRRYFGSKTKAQFEKELKRAEEYWTGNLSTEDRNRVDAETVSRFKESEKDYDALESVRERSSRMPLRSTLPKGPRPFYNADDQLRRSGQLPIGPGGPAGRSYLDGNEPASTFDRRPRIYEPGDPNAPKTARTWGGPGRPGVRKPGPMPGGGG